MNSFFTTPHRRLKTQPNLISNSTKIKNNPKFTKKQKFLQVYKELQSYAANKSLHEYINTLINYNEIWSLYSAIRCIKFGGIQQNMLFVNALIKISKICINEGKYEQATKVLKCALEYSWCYKLKQRQIQIYDYLGLICYYKNDLQSANLYHKRFNEAKLQNQNSIIRKYANYKLIKRIQENKTCIQIFSQLFYDEIKFPQCEQEFNITIDYLLRYLFQKSEFEDLFITKYLIGRNENNYTKIEQTSFISKKIMPRRNSTIRNISKKNKEFPEVLNRSIDKKLILTHLSSNRFVRKKQNSFII